ncbi:MAG: hypothetical protein E6Q40_04530 [Cupriavidus sp.]|nr:MAG: hypothetical protein E6Q40_04530 [Cupriavidus sp.]
MTIAEMRAALGIGPEYSDAYVVDAYARSIGPAAATPSVSEPPITLQAAKRQLALVDFDDDDTLIAELLAGAVDIVERSTGLVLSRRPVIEEAADLTPMGMKIRAWPIASVDAVTYIARDGTEQLLDSTLYRYSAGRPQRRARIMPTGPWPSVQAGAGAVTIAVTAGFDSPEDVPTGAILALKMLLAEFYLNREVGALSADAERSLKWLLRDFKVKTL